MATKQREFTATVYILHDNKVLLVQHKKFNKWMPPGGHLEPNETPHEAALREAREETGLHIEIISQENVQIHTSEAISLPRPHLCLLEDIPAHKDRPPHQHVDMIFLARPVTHTPLSDEARWFSREEIERLMPHTEIFEDAKQILLMLLKG